jgi:hypothetical protein
MAPLPNHAPYTLAEGEADASRIALIDAMARYQRCLVIARSTSGPDWQLQCQHERQQLALAAGEVATHDPVLASIIDESLAVMEAYRGSRWPADFAR